MKIETLSNAPEAFNSGQGSETNKLITQASTGLQVVETVAGLVTGPLVSVGVSVGASYSSSKSNVSQHLAHMGYWVGGQDLSLTSGNNVNIEGTAVQAGRYLAVSAANDLTIQSALSTIYQTSSSRSVNASFGVSFGLGLQGATLGANVAAGFSKGDSYASAVYNTNSQLSGGAVTLKSGGNTTVAGANVTGGTVSADVGGNLSVESRQDTVTSRSSQIGINLGLSIGLGNVSSNITPAGEAPMVSALGYGFTPNTNFLGQTGTMLSNAGSFLANGGSGPLTNVGGGDSLKNSGSFSFSYGRSSEDKAWTNQQTSITATDALTLTVANNTHVKGAIIESSANALKIDTGTFTYENIRDYDKTKSVTASVGVTIPLGSFEWQKTPTAAAAAPASAKQAAASQTAAAQQAGASGPMVAANPMPGVAVSWPTDSGGQQTAAAYGLDTPASTGLPAIWPSIGTSPQLPSAWASAGSASSGGWQTYVVPNQAAGTGQLSPAMTQPATPSLMAQLGQAMAKYPVKFQMAYKATRKERTTFATVGAGTINIRDASKQAAMVKAGVTGALASVNRDLAKTHSVTTVKVNAVNAFVSTQSLLTIKNIAVKVSDYIAQAIEEGKLPSIADVNRKRIIDTLKDLGLDPASVSACLGGGSGSAATQSGSLFNLLFSPAYADTFRECYIRFNGLNALVGQDGIAVPESIIREAAQKAAAEAWKNAASIMQTMGKLEPDSDLYNLLGDELTKQLSYFELCASDAEWTARLSTQVTLEFKALDDRYFNAAVIYQERTNDFMDKNGFLSIQNRADLNNFKQTSPDLYKDYAVSNDSDLKKVITADYYGLFSRPVSPLDAII